MMVPPPGGLHPDWSFVPGMPSLPGSFVKRRMAKALRRCRRFAGFANHRTNSPSIVANAVKRGSSEVAVFCVSIQQVWLKSKIRQS